MELEGEIVIVTGAGRGIGAATASVLAARGARVVAAARTLADAQAVAAAAPPGQILPLACDVSDPAAVAVMVAATCARFGPPTALVNNAGVVAPIGPLHEVEPEDFAAAIRTTLVGAAFCARAVLPAMVKSGRGRIINLSSGAAHRPMEGWSAYCVAKAGLAMLTRSLALDYGAQGLVAIGFAPGLVDTEMQVAIRASGINPVSRISREALAPALDPARAIAFLCSPAGSSFAGQEVDIRDTSFRAAAQLP